jgi:carbamoyltransferase
MNFLGIHTGTHDSNFTFTSGKNIRYFKSERFKQIKHHAYYGITTELLNDLEKFGIDINKLDAVAISDQFNLTDAEEKQYHLLKQTVFNCPTYSVNHHYSHALSCFPLENYNLVTKKFVLDGAGVSSSPEKQDYETISVFDNQGIVLKKYRLPEVMSLGRALRILGQHWNLEGHKTDHAGKLMAYQSYGKIDLCLIKQLENLNITQIEKLFSNPPTEPCHDWLRNRHFISEKIINDFFKYLSLNSEYISYSGGVAHNILINSQLKQWNNNIVIPPHCGDDGISLGQVELLRQIYQQEPFINTGFPYWQQDEVKELPSKTVIKKAAEMIANGKIIGWCQGKGEIGARALGNRSILMRADLVDGKDIINTKVKHREHYRPFGCSILLEDTNKHMDCNFYSPYMLYSVNVSDSSLKSITHVDGTTRPQTVVDGLFSELLLEVKKLTGSSIVLNTSLNVNGFPIATPEYAINLKHKLDGLFIGNSYI